MDLNQAMNFIRWDQQRKTSKAAGQRTEQGQQLARQRFAFDYAKELRRMREKEIDNDKYVISSMTQAYKDAPDLASKRVIQEGMRNFYGAVHPSLRPALKIHIDRSPISPMEVKRNEFFRAVKMPERPAEGFKDDKYAEANFMFRKAKIEAQYNNFLVGTPYKEKSFLPMEDGMVAHQSEDGGISFYTAEELGHQKIAEKLGIPLIELYSNDGWYTSKESVGEVTEANGDVKTVHRRVNAFRGAKLVKDAEGKMIPARGEEPFEYKFNRKAATPIATRVPEATRTLIADIIADNTDNPNAQYFRKKIIAGGDSQIDVARQLSGTHPGLVFNIRSNRTGWDTYPILGWFIGSGGAKISIGVTEGVQTILPIPGYKPKKVWINYDGVIRDGFGSIVGTNAEEAVRNYQYELKNQGGS